ncbi:hypothetical protein GCM10028827_38050 [Mucilaginibacter myungsuensis]
MVTVLSLLVANAEFADIVTKLNNNAMVYVAVFMIYNCLILSTLFIFCILITSIRRCYFQNVTDKLNYFYYIKSRPRFEAAKV